MTISIWRYSHLALAVSSFIFILIASLTGIVLAVEPVQYRAQIGSAALADNTPVGQTIAALKQEYAEVFSLSVDENDYVIASVVDQEGEFLEFYIDPETGKKVADLIEKPAIYQWMTNLHRSLFLKSTGRFFVGLFSFLLFLIAVSSIALIAKRQQGLRNFFQKIIKDDWWQYSHVYLGRISLIPIVLVTLTGVYLSLLRFELIPAPMLSHQVDYDSLTAEPQLQPQQFPLFANTAINQITSVEFPFSEDVEDYYKLSLKDREVLVNQYTGALISELPYPFTTQLSALSISWHTGRSSVVWAVVLGISMFSIPYFIWSGFAMTLKRRSSRIKNRFKKDECEYIILVGSETGSTMGFATHFQQALIKAGKKAYLTELNRFEHFKSMKHLVVFAATYGKGEAPANAARFKRLFTDETNHPQYHYAVVGFGSLAYADFCQYAYDIEALLKQDQGARALIPVFTINNRSWEAFKQWSTRYTELTDIPLEFDEKKTGTTRKQKLFTILERTHGSNDTFLLRLKSEGVRYKSGDLLAVYANDKTHERLYSIAKVAKNEILLSVKRHNLGLCSNHLNDIPVGTHIRGTLVRNKSFHFPKKAPEVLLISTGTGIAPFLGMLQYNHTQTKTSLYWGGHDALAFALYQPFLEEQQQAGRLHNIHRALSRQTDEKVYVQHLLERDAPYIAELLVKGGVLMLCGSVSMQKEVIDLLQHLCEHYKLQPLSYYQNKGQLLMDCY